MFQTTNQHMFHGQIDILGGEILFLVPIKITNLFPIIRFPCLCP